MGFASELKDLYAGRGVYGTRVFRAGRALALDLGLAAFNIFRVTGGDVLITCLYGKVVAGPIAGAAVPRIQHTPTGGALAPLCAAAASIAADAVNTIYTFSGLPTDLLVPGGVATGEGVGFASMWTNMQILVPGIISVTNAVVATQGVIDWTCFYVPLAPGAVVSRWV